MCNQSLFKWWRHLHYWRNNSQRQFEHRKFDANLLRYYIQILLGYVQSKFVQMLVPPTLLAIKIAEDNLNKENLMQTFENLLLQNY